MKKISVIILVLFVAACSKTRTPDTIRNEIGKEREAIAKINDKISVLEEELAKVDTVTEFSSIKIGAKLLAPEVFIHSFEATGNMEPVNSAFISPQMAGQIEKIYVRKGQQVKAGDLLISLNADVLKNSIAELETGLELATITFKKQEELWNNKVGSEIQFLQAKNGKESLERKLQTLRSQLRLSSVYAPIDGIVDEILFKVGEIASPGVQLVQLVNLGEMFIHADISESYITKIDAGDAVDLIFPSFDNLKMKANISRVGNMIKEANRTFRIEIKINNPGGKFKPNNIVRIELVDYENDKALVIPSKILKKDIEGDYVFIIKEENGRKVASKVYVKPGISQGENTIVTSGLKENDMVITEGYHLVKNGSEISL